MCSNIERDRAGYKERERERGKQWFIDTTTKWTRGANKILNKQEDVIKREEEEFSGWSDT